MSKIDIGIKIDLEKLISSRLLVQASSGGGKSYAIRKLAEQLIGHVQVIIIDIEGEFVSLREKFPFALVGKEGEIPLNLRYAETLAHKLLETNLSAIIDLSEMEVYQRRMFAKRFAHALIESPKHLWHPCIIIIDEADFFAPQGKDSESTNAIVNLSSRGRKRGICPIYATQRIAKLHKDVTADVLNKIIGLTGQDIDQQRAGSELGFVSKEDIRGLRKLSPGEFHAFGPAISNEVVKFKVSKVATSHMEAGQYKKVLPATPNAIKKILGKLADIPEEAEKELNTKKELELEIKRLKGELRSSKIAVSPDNPKVHDEKLKEKIVLLQDQNKELNTHTQKWKNYSIQIIKLYQTLIMNYQKKFSQIGKILDEVVKTGVQLNIPAPEDIQLPKINVSIPAVNVAVSTKRTVEKVKRTTVAPSNGQMDNTLSKSALTFLQALCMYYPEFISRSRLSLVTGYKITSSNFGNTLTELRAKGYMKDGPDKSVATTEEGFNNVGHFDPLPTDSDSLKTYWSRKVSKSASTFFISLFDRYPDFITREELSESTGYNLTSSNFGNTLTELRTLGIMEDGANKTVRAHPDLFAN